VTISLSQDEQFWPSFFRAEKLVISPLVIKPGLQNRVSIVLQPEIIYFSMGLALD